MGCSCDKFTRHVCKVGNMKQEQSSAERLGPCLTAEQIGTLRFNWQVLKLQVANIGVITYLGMFDNRPELIETFTKFKGKNLYELQQSGLLRAHALRVMATVDKCISRLDEPDNLAKLLRETGELHREHKVNPDQIQIIFPHFLNAIKPHIEDHWSDELADTWRTFFALIFHHMKEGMADDKHSAIMNETETFMPKTT